MRPIEEIRAAFHLIHHVATGQSDRAFMSIPARPEHDADLIVSAALDELELRRAEREWVDEAFIRGLRWARGAMLKAFGPLGPTPRYFDEAEKEILDLIASTERNVNLKAGENPSRPSVVEESLRAQVEALKAERDHWREEHDTRRGECLAAQMVEKAAQDRAERAQELQRGAEAQHCAALARVVGLEGRLAQWQAIARENAEEVDEQRDAAEAKLVKAREALLFGANLLSGHRYHWEHEGDEESGQHDEDCRACEYEAMLVRFEAALADEEPKPDPAPSARPWSERRNTPESRALVAQFKAELRAEEGQVMNRNVDWERLERDVVARIRALAAVCSDKLNAPAELRERIWEDLVLPNARLLAEFCTNVHVEEDEHG